MTLAFLKSPTIIALAAALSFAALQSYRLNSSQRTLAETKEGYAQSLAASEKEATEALQRAIKGREAVEHQLREIARQIEAEAAIETEQAKAEAKAWRQRFEQAKKDDPGCDAWSQERILCPVE